MNSLCSLNLQVQDSDALEGSGTDFGAGHVGAGGSELELISSSASSEAAIEAKWAA